MKKIIPVIIPLFLFILGLKIPFCEKEKENNQILISGWVEIDTVKIAPLIGGRIIELNLEEGATIKKDEIVAKIDCKELELQLKQAEASYKGALAQLNLIKKGARKEDIANMRELVKQAEIAKENATKDFERAKKLFETNSITQKQYDDAQLRYDSAQTQLAALKQQYSKLLAGAQEEEIESAYAMVEQAESSIALFKEKLSHCIIYSPLEGTILNKLIEIGEIVTPGMSLAIVGNLSKVKVKGYIAEEELNFIKLGHIASVFTDSEPENPLTGKVTYISPQAEFTPKNIQTQKERIKTMYAIKVSVDNSEGKLKNGMPVDILIIK